MTGDPTKHLIGLGRQDAVTGMLHGHIRWPNGSPATPFGCRWCGIAASGHGRRWIPGRNIHAWEQPTEAQILARMRARRAAHKAACRCVEPWEQQSLAPVVDPWSCEADNCRMHDYIIRLWLTPMSSGDVLGMTGGAS